MRHCLFFLLLVAVCVFQSHGSRHHERKARKHHRDVINLDELPEKQVPEEAALKKSNRDENDDLDETEREFDDDEEDDDDEDFDGELPHHPVHGVTNQYLLDMVFRSRRPSCSNRKCIRWYRGWWSTSCGGTDTVATNYCAKTGKWCCARCKPKDWCIVAGGACVIRGRCDTAANTIKANGCFGKCVCCIPIAKK